MLKDIKKSKKAIMYEFIVRLVIAIVMVTTAIYIGSSFFRLSDQALESYNGLIEEINSIQQGELRSARYMMDRRTALIGFSKDAEKVTVWDNINGGEGFFLRPSYCDINNSCLCLCREGWTGSLTPVWIDEDDHLYWGEKYGVDSTYRAVEHNCEELYCENLKRPINIFNMTDERTFGSLAQGIESVFDNPNRYLLRGGFVHTRGIPAGLNHFPGMPDRSITIYIERLKDTVGICLDSPCIPQQIKERQ